MWEQFRFIYSCSSKRWKTLTEERENLYWVLNVLRLGFDIKQQYCVYVQKLIKSFCQKLLALFPESNRIEILRLRTFWFSVLRITKAACKHSNMVEVNMVHEPSLRWCWLSARWYAYQILISPPVRPKKSGLIFVPSIIVYVAVCQHFLEHVMFMKVFSQIASI